MTREELRTLAALDVFGLLDEYETNLYTRSFHHASAAVQDEIIELQAAIAQNPPLLTEEEPKKELRDRVMQAIANAMDSESRKFAPIASIGRNRARLNGEAGQRHVHVRGTYFWRAATFVLAGALVAVLYFFADTAKKAEQLSELALSGWTAERAKELLGPGFESFVNNPNCDHLRMLPPGDLSSAAYGIVSINRASEQAFLFTAGLPLLDDNEQYVVRVKHSDGAYEVLQLFSPRAGVFGLRLERVTETLLASAVQWEIATLDGRSILLVSA